MRPNRSVGPKIESCRTNIHPYFTRSSLASLLFPLGPSLASQSHKWVSYRAKSSIQKLASKYCLTATRHNHSSSKPSHCTSLCNSVIEGH
ncbi:hypothetical protein SDJN03_07990, partial [Cucurbita argyrosperma subsp. sororia]